MHGPTVRELHEPDEQRQAARVVAYGMLGPLDHQLDRVRIEGSRVLGAFDEDGVLCGTARWFASTLRIPGGEVSTAALTGVAVLPTHRRRGHLGRLMAAFHEQACEAGCATAVLIAAEWPIYGRYGYGPATTACGWRVDARAARFLRPPTGRVRLLSGEDLRPLVDPIVERHAAATPGTLRRSPATWDLACGIVPPGSDPDPRDPGDRRYAVWFDEGGRPDGFVRYQVEGRWTANRPDATARADLLVATSPEARRELWRHLCEIDWVGHAVIGPAPIDDPVPFELHDARAATCADVSDNVWEQLLDVAAAFDGRTSPVAGEVVVEVTADQAGAQPAAVGGRWLIELGPDGGRATRTTASPDVTTTPPALGALHLGGTSGARLRDAGWLEERRGGGVARLDALLGTRPLPFNPLSF